MSKHTPGPWVALKAEQSVHEQDYYIASERGVVGYWVLTEADARLIAAAPELLDALVNLLPLISPLKAESQQVANASAAIAKATA
ncbi:TPA: hypothetical protein ACSPM7_005438 [Pseudomonas aeruginosa]